MNNINKVELSKIKFTHSFTLKEKSFDFSQKRKFWVFLGLNLKKATVTFEISTINFLNI